jgi:D-tyrosyl-tRNA(Tyr) deacylase
MRLVVQRVLRAEVHSDGAVLGQIGRGAVILVGIGRDDTPDIVDRMADKLVGLRYFTDLEGRTNASIADVGGALLVVSQFTLYADLRRGRRPGFTAAAEPQIAATLVERFVGRLRGLDTAVETGRFGAVMEVELVNDGPFTLIIDSDRDLAG